MKCGEKWFPKNYEKFRLENFRSESLSIRTSKGRAAASELVLLMGGLPYKIALQGGSGEASSPKFDNSVFLYNTLMITSVCVMVIKCIV